MSGEKSSLHPFLMEPMAELESGVDFLDTVNIEDERNIELKGRNNFRIILGFDCHYFAFERSPFEGKVSSS